MFCQITTKFSRTYSKIRSCNQFFLIINTPPIWIGVIKHSDFLFLLIRVKKKIGKTKKNWKSKKKKICASDTNFFSGEAHHKN